MNLSAAGRYGTLVLAAALLDQAVKQLVETVLPLHERIDLLPFLTLLHARNTGIAFSMFSSLGDWALSVIVLAVMAFVVALALRTEAAQRWARVGFALILGGASGNLIDRLSQGFVTDYIYLHTPQWSFAIFNLADIFISLGAAMVVLQEVLDWNRTRGHSN